MKPFLSSSLVLTLLLTLTAGAAPAAADQTTVRHRDETNADDALSQLRGDYALIVPGRDSATRPALLPYAEFVALYGGSVAEGGIVQGDDGGESIVPTPGPPGTGMGFEPGDTVILHRTSGPWIRTTTYRYMGSHIWYMQSNILKGPYDDVEE